MGVRSSENRVRRRGSWLLPMLAGLIGLSSAAAAQSTAQDEARQRAANMAAFPDAARTQFGRISTPAAMEPRAIGFYARGCLAGAQAMPLDGDTWQVMRTARNRNWGHPDLIATLRRLAREVPRITGWPGLLFGDISQPRGGPMLTGHASHQIGLDADIWLTPMPRTRLSGEQRENMPATNMVRSDWMDADPRAWTPAHVRLIKAVTEDPRVERVFVNPALKAALCRDPAPDRSWLNKVRPTWGHNYHFHVRITCPAGAVDCTGQETPDYGDGCGEELTDWLTRQHRAIFGPKTGPVGKPKPPLTVDALPAACRQVLEMR
jgi:penicillin-insensitive murein endopeptidase